MLLKHILQAVFKIVCGYAVFRGVGYGLLAEVVEGERTGRRESPASGVFQDEPHQLQGDLGFALALLHTGASLRPVRAGDYTGGASRYGRIESALIPDLSPTRDSETRAAGPREVQNARG